MIRTRFICLLFFMYSCNANRPIDNFVIYFNRKKIECSQFEDEIREYWRIDSVGLYGFRALASEIIQKCDCNAVGKDWKSYYDLFGSPNFTESFDNFTVYTYRLSNYGNISAPGQKYLKVFVDKNNIIIKFKIRKIDG